MRASRPCCITGRAFRRSPRRRSSSGWSNNSAGCSARHRAAPSRLRLKLPGKRVAGGGGEASRVASRERALGAGRGPALESMLRLPAGEPGRVSHVDSRYRACRACVVSVLPAHAGGADHALDQRDRADGPAHERAQHLQRPSRAVLGQVFVHRERAGARDQARGRCRRGDRRHAPFRSRIR